MIKKQIKDILSSRLFYLDVKDYERVEQYVIKYELTEEELKNLIEDLSYDDFVELMKDIAENNKLVTFDSLKEILERRAKDMLQYFSSEDIRALTLFFHKQNYTTRDVEQVLVGAKRKLDISDKGYVRYSEDVVKQYVSDVMQKENLKLFQRYRQIFSDIYRFFKVQNIKTINLSSTLKEFYAATEDAVEKQDEQTIELLNERLDCLEKIMSIYRVMLTNLGGRLTDVSDTRHYKKVENGLVYKFNKEKFAKDVGRLADHIMTSAILKLKTKIDAFNAENIQGYIDELQRVGDKDMFSIEEVASLLMEASSILPRATASKLRHVKVALNDYVTKLAQTYSEDSELTKVTAKALMLKVRSLTIENPKHISEAVKMLFGNSIKETIASVERFKSEKELSLDLENKSKSYLEYAQKTYMYKFFPNLKIQGLNAETHRYVTTTRGSMLSALNVGTVYNTTRDLVICLYKAHFPEDDRVLSFKYKAENLIELGYDINTIYTSENIFDLFPIKLSDRVKKDGTTVRTTSKIANNVIDNTQILKIIISPADIQKIIQHNANFILQNPQVTWNQVKKIFEENKTKQDIERAITEFVNEIVTKQNAKTGSANSERRYVRKNIKIQKSRIEIDKFVFDIEKIKDLLKLTTMEDTMAEISKTNDVKIKKSEEKSSEAKKLEEAIDSGDLAEESITVQTWSRVQTKNVLKDRYYGITEEDLIKEIIRLAESAKSFNEDNCLELKFALEIYMKDFVAPKNALNVRKLVKALSEVVKALENAIEIGKSDDKFYYDMQVYYLQEIKTAQERIQTLQAVKKKNSKFSKEQREVLRDLYDIDIDEKDKEVESEIDNDIKEVRKTKSRAKTDLSASTDNSTILRRKIKVKNLLVSAVERMGITLNEGIEITQELIKAKEAEIRRLQKENESLERIIDNKRKLIKSSLGDKFEKLTDEKGKLKRPHSGIGKLESSVEAKEKTKEQNEERLALLQKELEMLRENLEEIVSVD